MIATHTRDCAKLNNGCAIKRPRLGAIANTTRRDKLTQLRRNKRSRALYNCEAAEAESDMPRWAIIAATANVTGASEQK